VTFCARRCVKCRAACIRRAFARLEPKINGGDFSTCWCRSEGSADERDMGPRTQCWISHTIAKVWNCRPFLHIAECSFVLAQCL
jgi:hypothetical protein